MTLSASDLPTPGAEVVVVAWAAANVDDAVGPACLAFPLVAQTVGRSRLTVWSLHCAGINAARLPDLRGAEPVNESETPGSWIRCAVRIPLRPPGWAC